MIKAKYLTNNSKFEFFEITGHAQTTKNVVNDLVCAGVSSIVFGILNSLNQDEITIEVSDNLVIIKENCNDENEIILKVLLKSLKTVESSYQEFIKIKVTNK